MREIESENIKFEGGYFYNFLTILPALGIWQLAFFNDAIKVVIALMAKDISPILALKKKKEAF